MAEDTRSRRSIKESKSAIGIRRIGMKYKIFWLDNKGEKKEKQVKKDRQEEALLEAFFGYLKDNSESAPFGIVEEIED